MHIRKLRLREVEWLTRALVLPWQQCQGFLSEAGSIPDPCFPLLVSGPASAILCTSLPLPALVTPGPCSPERWASRSAWQSHSAEHHAKAPGEAVSAGDSSGHTLILGGKGEGRRGGGEGGREEGRRREPESRPGNPWGCSLKRFPQLGKQQSDLSIRPYAS